VCRKPENKVQFQDFGSYRDVVCKFVISVIIICNYSVIITLYNWTRFFSVKLPSHRIIRTVQAKVNEASYFILAMKIRRMKRALYCSLVAQWFGLNLLISFHL
jgi:hypothetical protein